MRIALLIATFALGLKVALPVYATVSEKQEQRAEQFCKVNSDFC
jgi:hypothetical protein